MKYTIVVDKQSRTNPSNEKREISFEIDELRKKGDVHDDLVIENGQAKVIRRIALSKYNVTSVLENEVIEELGEAKIPLFEGDNYIYVKDEYNNQMCAEYIVKSDFTDMYVTNLKMEAAIEESARQINLSVSQKLESYSNTEEVKAMINMLSNQIALELTKKVNGEDITGASIILMINENKSSAKISADMITLTANDVLNILANNEMNFTSKNMSIKSTNFSVDKNGNITAKGGTIGGFTLEENKFSTTINGTYDFNVFDAKFALITSTYGLNLPSNLFNLYNVNGDSEIDAFDAQQILKIALGQQTNNKKITGTFEINTNNPKNFISVKHGSDLAVSIGVGRSKYTYFSSRNDYMYRNE